MIQELNICDRDAVRKAVILNQKQINFPVTRQGPTEQHQRQSDKLVKVLIEKHDFSGSKAVDNRKKEIVQQLQQIVEEWSRKIASDRGYDEKAAKQCVARLLPYGSYLLGVSSDQGDLDLVCVAPNFIDRDQNFKEELRDELKQHPSVQNAHDVKTSKNPIIQLEFNGQDVDISLGILPTEKVPENIEEQIKDEMIIQIIQDTSIDETLKQNSINALNGRRNNQKIYQSVPDSCRESGNYSNLLQCLQVWSKKKGLSNNKMGFFGGIVLAIMAARVCQFFPNYSLCQLLEEFFDCFSRWDFEGDQQVTIIPELKVLCQVPEKLSWNNLRGKEKMKIFTPSFPYINTTNKVNDLTFVIIKKHLNDTNEWIAQMDKSKWQEFFEEPVNYFESYDNFIEIDVLGKGVQQEEFTQFQDYVESRFISLYSNIIKIINPPNCNIDYLTGFEFNPQTSSIKLQDSEFDFCEAFLIGFKNELAEYKHQFNLLHTFRDFLSSIKITDGMDMRIFYTKKQPVLQKISDSVAYFDALKSELNNKTEDVKEESQINQIKDQEIDEDSIEIKQQQKQPPIEEWDLPPAQKIKPNQKEPEEPVETIEVEMTQGFDD